MADSTSTDTGSESENDSSSPGDHEDNSYVPPSSRNASIHLSVRRGDIIATSIKEGENELQDLGIEAYDQTTYERRVFEQVDEAISNVAPTTSTNQHQNRSDLVNLIQNGDNIVSSDDEVESSQDNDERILQLTRLERNRIVIKRERGSPEPEVPRAPKIPRFSAQQIKSEPLPNETKFSPSSKCEAQTGGSTITLFWRPAIANSDEDSNAAGHQQEAQDDSYQGQEQEEKEKEDDDYEDDEHDIGLSDDIDYETDDEAGPKRADIKIKTTKFKRVVDDANADHYRARMKEYTRQRAKIRLQNIGEDGVDAKQLDELVPVQGQLQIPKEMWDNLFEHQKIGVKWLWELHQLGTGGILGDEMGLGKTIQTIAFLTSLKNSTIPSSNKGYQNLGPCVLVCPATVMYQWLLEFRKWWPPFRIAILHSTGTFSGDWNNLVNSINKSNGILIVSYPGVVIYQDILHAFNWHYAILDEGHKIRNPDAQITLACKRFRTPHRLILSGSPVQNNLKELWSIFDFIYPGKLGTLPVFMQQFSIPITQGGYANASDVQVQIAYKCSCVLRDTIKPFLLRRTKAEVNNKLKLPDRSEQVLFCKLTDRQYQLYDNFLKSPVVRDIKAGLLQIFVGLTQLRKICNHPDLFDSSDTWRKGASSNGNSSKREEWDFDSGLMNDRSFGCYKRSGKMMVVDALLNIWKKQGDKVLLFTQSRQMLKIFQRYLDDKQYSYLSMDGTTSIGMRQQIIDKFNQTKDIFIFLLTTRVGGVGINLVGANRIIIFDPDWNPSTDIQARERAWRIGQNRQVIIYRLLTAGTIEEKIYHRQVFKLYLTNRILRDAKQKRFFKTNDLHELFTLGDNEKNIETKALFDDDLQINPDDLKKRKLQRDQDKKKREEDKLARKEERKRKKLEVKESLRNQNYAIKLSEEQLQIMRERAKKISQMIASEYSTTSNCQSSSSSSSKNNQVANRNPFLNGVTNSRETVNPSAMTTASSSSSISPRKPTKERVEYLVRQDVYRSGGGDVMDKRNDTEQQQDYILDRLFKSSNVFGALKHDKIEGDLGADFKVIESEAEKVARDAIRVLRESRRMCMSSLSGVPNWTGQNGQLAQPSNSSRVFGSNPQSRYQATSSRLVPKNKSRAQQFLGMKRLGSGNGLGATTVSGSPTSVKPSELPSKQPSLLATIRSRNHKNPIDLARETFGVSNNNGDEDENGPGSSCDGRAEGTGAERMADMLRDYMLHRANSHSGDVQTDEILEFFNSNFKPQDTAIFKALLYKICTFKRLGAKGFWNIKNEFRNQEE